LQRTIRRPSKTWLAVVVTMALAVPAVALTTPAGADPGPPWDGTPISQGLGPTYGEAWCAEAAPGSNIANQQVYSGPPPNTLALMPQEAIRCTLDQFLAEADAAGIPPRMTYSVIGQSAGGRDLYGVVVNALETPEQQRDYDRWVELRATLLDDPAGAQALLEQWGDDVKIPIFIEANIHGGEEEGTDAIMQAIRDLATTPHGENAVVDSLLDHAVLIVIPSENPDGRFSGRRQNDNGLDMNRDFLVQSQSEVRAERAFQLQWLAPVGLAMHCCGNPTLIDGLTKPHNPGLDYDLFAYWNQLRLDANEAAHNAIGREIQRPVNDYNSDGNLSPPPVGPEFAEGWDDWGPFYTQTYMAFYGVDSSTVEMCSNTCDGRIGSKTAQYITFYSSADFWIANRSAMLHDQAEIFRRGVEAEPRPNCCDDPLLIDRGFTEEQHNWMVPYPKAFAIPFGGDAQRSDAEANRLVQWLLDNGIKVERTRRAFEWGGRTLPSKSYVVWMDQPFRGLALTALDPGQDVSDRITQLYAPPGAWSHGQLWGADVVEIPADDPTFAPATTPIAAPNPLKGTALGGGPGTWFAVSLGGALEVSAALELLRGGIDAEIAEEDFTTSSGTEMPAGSLIFTWSPGTVAALQQAANRIGFDVARSTGAKPPTTMVTEAPRVAVLTNATTPLRNDTFNSLERIFGSDGVEFVSVLAGGDSLQNAPSDPLEDVDVIYNAGQNYPSSTDTVARDRLDAFFARGGGYIGTSVSGNNFTFLTGAGLVTSPLTQGSDSGADGGIAIWNNAGGPVTGVYPSQDYLFLDNNITYFSATPNDAVIDGRYLPSTTDLFVAGLWRNRNPAVADSPMAVHGTTTADSRYAGLAANPFSRMDAEREWLWVGQAALWSNLTDEA
jgi:Zinc carboxypeptidase